MRAFASTLLAGATGALVVVVLVGQAGPLTLHDEGIEFPDGSLQTTAAAGDHRRAFYLTASGWDGASALHNACASGFHMASLWEILDVTAVRYATDSEGAGDVLRRDDSGAGPPSNTWGWVRTGWSSNGTQANTGSSGDGGFVNCEAWMSNASDKDGTAVRLNYCWQEDADCGITPSLYNQVAPWWIVGDSPCSTSRLVWCVED